MQKYVLIQDKAGLANELLLVLNSQGANQVRVAETVQQFVTSGRTEENLLVFIALAVWNQQTAAMKQALALHGRVVLLIKQCQQFYSAADFDPCAVLRAPFSKTALGLVCGNACAVKGNAMQKETPVAASFYIQYNRCFRRIYYKDLLYLEAWKNYVRIHTQQQEYVIAHSLRKLKQLLPGDEFIQVHRSFIVPVQKVPGNRNSQVSIGGQNIPLGRTWQRLHTTRACKHTADNRY